MKAPDQCRNMRQLRDEIDALDVALVDLLAKRAGYIDRAVTLKAQEGLPARTTDRVAEVLAYIKSLATARDLDPDLATSLWTTLIEWGISREEDAMNREGDKAEHSQPKALNAYRFITGPDDIEFCHRVTELLNRGWALAGPSALTFDTKRNRVICGQPLTKDVVGSDWSQDIDLSLL